MGVVNLSRDSWYRESVAVSREAAIRRGRVLAAQGADLVDLGAESTILDAERVDVRRQIEQLVPVVEALHADGILVSVETYEPEVVEACLVAGAALLNLTGTAHHEEIFALAAAHDAAVVLCFVDGDNVREVGEVQLGEDPLPALLAHFEPRIAQARAAGVERLFVDPGLGFYYANLQDGVTRVRHQAGIFLNTFRLRELGFPVCHALPHAFDFFGEEVRSAEGFFAVLAALGRTGLFRTHEVPRVRAILDTLEAIAPGR
ncbi:MAG: dihydropteroate synthase [Actinobacteria bacterium]|nr:dihydropteroate synthase [Actinomycetota bacterium]